jgi:Arc/MetJ-type ribon-helix-helix transcriptional regulator
VTARKPGRPEIGPNVNVRMPQDLIDWIDRRAKKHGKTRAEYIRGALGDMRDTLESTEATHSRSRREDWERPARLSQPQQEILYSARAHGETLVDGQRLRSVRGLADRGLVTYEKADPRRREVHRLGFPERPRYVVRPTRAPESV